MNTRIQFIIFVVLLLWGVFISHTSPLMVIAQTISPSPTGSPETIHTEKVASESAQSTDSADLRKLRDKLASAVAQMRKKDEQVVAGEVAKVDGIQFELNTLAGSIEKIQIDETLTKYYRIAGAAKEDIERKEITVGKYIIVTGLRTEGMVSANEIYVDDPFESRAGRITEINSVDGTFKLETFDKETLTINVERSTYQEYLNTLTLNVGQGGFSLMKEGDVAHIVYQMRSIKEQVTTIIPTRLLVIPARYFSK